MTTAIETEYAGHRFRSRLEARWAVFFDHLGVKWLYEPQGYTLGNGERYLPDFWLPERGVWAEVKGASTDADLIRARAAAASDGLPLSYRESVRPIDLDPRDRTAPVVLPRVLMLGEVPTRLGACGWLHPTALWNAGHVSLGMSFFFQHGIYWAGLPGTWRHDRSLWNGHAWAPIALDGQVADAYGAARKARFEHGEAGYEKPALKDGLERVGRR